MPISVRCPKCQKKLQAPDSLAGKRAKCPHCGQLMRLPEPAPQTEEVEEDKEVLEDLGSSDPLGPPTTDQPADGLDTSSTFSEQQFDEMLADVGTRAEAKPSEPPPNSYPCPICHELIVRGSPKCPFCGEDFNQYLQPQKQGSNAASHFANSMNALGGTWIGLALLAMGMLFLGIMGAAAWGDPQGEGVIALLIVLMLPCLLWVALGMATCRKAMWAVWFGLILTYLGVVLAAVLMVLTIIGSGEVTSLIGSFIRLAVGVVVIGMAHRCIYWKRQMR